MKGISLPTYLNNIFKDKTVDDLANMTAGEILRTRRVGRKGYNYIRDALKKIGLTLKGKEQHFIRNEKDFIDFVTILMYGKGALESAKWHREDLNTLYILIKNNLQIDEMTRTWLEAYEIVWHPNWGEEEENEERVEMTHDFTRELIKTYNRQ